MYALVTLWYLAIIIVNYLYMIHNYCGTDPQVVLDPDSRLIPVGAEALFTCEFRNVIKPYWEINGIKATNDFNIINLRDQGFYIDPEQTSDIDGTLILTMRVNGSYPRLHNSHIQCKSFSQGIHSDTATLLTIDGNERSLK